MNKNIIGFPIEIGEKPKIKNYDSSIEIRQKELETKINNLIKEFQDKEKVVVLVDYESDNYQTEPISTRLIVNLKS